MFIERSTQDGEEKVVLRYVAAYYWLMWPTIGLTAFAMSSSLAPVKFAAGVGWLLMLAVLIPYWPVSWKLKKQMKDSQITASGSKYSFSNPLTYRWPQPEKDGSDS